jgi:transcriptional antiterminator NusG
MMGVNVRIYEKNEFIEMVDLSSHFGPLEAPIPKRWYALELHTNRETRVMRTFRQRNISFYFPTITQSKILKRRRRGYEITVKRDVTSPLFPGLVFIPDFQRELGGVLGVDGVADFLRFGEWTAYLSAKLMSDVRTLESYGHIPLSRRKRLFALGQVVRVVDGPFASFNGIIDRLDSNARLSVLVGLFKRMVPVMLDEDQIEAV